MPCNPHRIAQSHSARTLGELIAACGTTNFPKPAPMHRGSRQQCNIPAARTGHPHKSGTGEADHYNEALRGLRHRISGVCLKRRQRKSPYLTRERAWAENCQIWCAEPDSTRIQNQQLSPSVRELCGQPSYLLKPIISGRMQANPAYRKQCAPEQWWRHNFLVISRN